MSSLDAKLRRRLEQALQTCDSADARAIRLADDAMRLFNRLHSFGKLQLVRGEPDFPAIELSCFALQLPLRPTKHSTPAKLARISLRDRAEQGVELLAPAMGDSADDDLLERATRILHDVHRKQPLVDDARLLADAVNLDDFGSVGSIVQAMQLARQGGGIAQFIVALERRDEYGYWDARLKDGFHFERVRDMARKRLENTHKILQTLRTELDEDRP